MKANGERAAMRFTSARYLDRQRMLDVTFENGDHFCVAVEAVLPARSRAVPAAEPEWAALRVGETGDVLEVPADGAVIEIPWDRIRATADAEFRGQLADRALERARRIGGRIRAMRREAGLTPVTLAEKVGVSREVIADLEAGKIEPRLALIEEIAIVLGKRLRDFAEE